MGILSKIFGDGNEKAIKGLRPLVEKVNNLEKDYEKIGGAELKARTSDLKERIAKGESSDDVLPEAFALCREAAKRALNQRHFDVQLMGGIVLHQGKIVEMRTGEGKTLVATLPAYLNALEGRGVHIVTVNDYLAKRDSAWMGKVYDMLGMSVGCITPESAYIYDGTNSVLRPCSKKEAYLADITYGTNNEFGFDYLRDNMAYDVSQMVQRPHNFAIVDEVDSILIDEARVPLIISGESDEKTEKYYHFAKVVAPLAKEQDYTLDEKMKTASFTEAGQDKVVKKLGLDPWQENDVSTTHQLESALRAKTLFLKDRDYAVKGGEIVIIDEFTGRFLPGRRWSGGLHQAVEAKENVQIKPESVTMATITFQNYFRLYKKISGMTGTALTSAEEFDKVYKLDVVSAPTNKPPARKDHADLIFKTEQGKLKAVARQIKKLHQKGQPALVGTRSVEKNEFLGKMLELEGIPHEILNAKNHEKEGQIIAQAGQKGAVTIATNMAGRGVDIMLGNEVAELGGLYVIGTERHDARRIDNQLRGRAGRQGDPGESQFYVSLEDDLMRIFGGDKIKSLMTTLNFPEDEPIQAGIISGAIESAQEKIEGFNFDARHHLLEYDDVMNKHREVIYKKRREFLELQDMQKRAICLRVLDMLWQEHLSYMENVRDSVRLRAYGGRDPLVEYKSEGHKAFSQLLALLDTNIEENLKRAENVKSQSPMPKVQSNFKSQDSIYGNVGRNDLCPCGSNKKWKKCHGKGV